MVFLGIICDWSEAKQWGTVYYYSSLLFGEYLYCLNHITWKWKPISSSSHLAHPCHFFLCLHALVRGASGGIGLFLFPLLLQEPRSAACQRWRDDRNAQRGEWSCRLIWVCVPILGMYIYMYIYIYIIYMYTYTHTYIYKYDSLTIFILGSPWMRW